MLGNQSEKLRYFKHLQFHLTQHRVRSHMKAMCIFQVFCARNVKWGCCPYKPDLLRMLEEYFFMIVLLLTMASESLVERNRMANTNAIIITWNGEKQLKCTLNLIIVICKCIYSINS